LEEKQISKFEENIIEEDDSNKKKVNQISTGKHTTRVQIFTR
jgi:hypothetical protein